MAVDEDKLNASMGQFVQDLGATVQAGMVVLGHRLGLYRAMAGAERYVREWLAAQAAAAGFGRFRRAAETPFNLVYDVRP